MYPDPAKADCKVKEEKTKTHSRHLERALGFVGGKSKMVYGDEENKQYFNELLARYPELVDEKHSVLWWLAQQCPTAIKKGIQVLTCSTC